MARKKGPTRSVTLRMPVARYELLGEVAEARGVDLSAVINQELSAREVPLENELALRRASRPAPRESEAALRALRLALAPADYEAVRAAADSLRAVPLPAAADARRARERLVKLANPDATLPPRRVLELALAVLGEVVP